MTTPLSVLTLFFPQGFGHAVYCARHALGIEDHDSNGEPNGARIPADDEATDVDCAESFLLLLGDHLYRRGPGTTQACASQLIHAYLEHGETGKPVIGLKVWDEWWKFL